jgi:hypothetical protein
MIRVNDIEGDRMSKPILPDAIIQAKEAQQHANKLSGEIVERIDYIVKTIWKAFHTRLATWYFDGAEEGGMGDLWGAYNEHDIHFVAEDKGTYGRNYSSHHFMILDRKGSEYNLCDNFPTRWLFENFEDEIETGKERYKAAEVAAKERAKLKREQKKTREASLAEAAKAKLSPQEIAALKRVL